MRKYDHEPYRMREYPSDPTPAASQPRPRVPRNRRSQRPHENLAPHNAGTVVNIARLTMRPSTPSIANALRNRSWNDSCAWPKNDSSPTRIAGIGRTAVKTYNVHPATSNRFHLRFPTFVNSLDSAADSPSSHRAIANALVGASVAFSSSSRSTPALRWSSSSSSSLGDSDEVRSCRSRQPRTSASMSSRLIHEPPGRG